MKIESAVSEIPIYKYNGYTLYLIILCTVSLLALNNFVKAAICVTHDGCKQKSEWQMPFGHLFFRHYTLSWIIVAFSSCWSLAKFFHQLEL